MSFPNALFPAPEVVAANSQGYVFRQKQVALAVNIALATKRPLLVTGLPGSGKSSLAKAVADVLGWGYISHVFTSRTRVEDLIVDVDLVRRLNDAQSSRKIGGEADYQIPGALWWAVSPSSAAARKLAVRPPGLRDDNERDVVVLLDEIDKAEPDLPNDLLIPLDHLELTIASVGRVRPEHHQVLVVITSNGEREMPPAFVRRCVVLDIKEQDEEFLVEVARSHLGERDDDLYLNVAKELTTAQNSAEAANRRMPSTAEFLDTVRACIRFDQQPGSDLWEAIAQTTLVKTDNR